jgi:hypothetical protein
MARRSCRRRNGCPRMKVCSTKGKRGIGPCATGRASRRTGRSRSSTALPPCAVASASSGNRWFRSDMAYSGSCRPACASKQRRRSASIRRRSWPPRQRDRGGRGERTRGEDGGVCLREWVAAMASDDLCYIGLVEVGRRIQARQASSSEVTQSVLDHIARLDGRLRSYATLTADLALAEALRGPMPKLRAAPFAGPCMAFPSP